MYQDLEEIADDDKDSWDDEEGFDDVTNISLDGSDVVSVHSRDSFGSHGSFPNEVELKFAPVLETVVEEEEGEDDADLDQDVEKLAALHPKFSKYILDGGGSGPEHSGY